MKVDISRNFKVKPRVVIHEHDVWSACNTLALIALPLLKKIREDKRGIPCPFAPEYPPEYYDTDMKEDPYFEEAQNKWAKVLDKMIFAMEKLAHNDTGIEMPIPTCQKGMSRNQRYARGRTAYDRGWERDERDPDEMAKWREETKELESQIQQGCELFGQYFQNLWT